MRNPLSERIVEIPPSGIRKFFDIVSEMKDAISLGVGEPDFETPWHIREEGIYSLEKGRTFYTSNAGLRELKVEISSYLKRRFDVTYDPDHEVMVTVGGSEAIDVALRAMLDPGDEVLIPQPCFVSYVPCTILANGVPVPIPLEEKDNFKLTKEKLLSYITPKSKILVLPFPNNPTGAVMTAEELAVIAEIVIEKDLFVLTDEIYGELTYGMEHTTIASFPGLKERTVLINGFSKAYAMTGWRLGYALGPKDIIKTMTKIHQFAIMSAPTMAQDAAVVALQPETDGAVQEMVEEYNMRRRLLLSRFRGMGIECFEPLGAFYVFPSIAKFGLPSEEFCERFLYDEHVAIVPGSAFGASGEGFARISYAKSLRDIETAMDRMERFIAKIQIER